MHNIIKRNKHFKSLDTYTHMPKRASDNRFTKLPYVHTIITKPKLNIRSYYVFFFFLHFLFLFHSTSQSNSQKRQLKNTNTQVLTVISVSFVCSLCTCFARVVTVLRKT